MEGRLSVRVVGEALIDLVGTPGTATYTAHPGGSPANVAVDLARLGVPVGFYGRIGTGAFGDRIREHLAGNGVDLTPAVAAPEPPTLAVATVDGDGAARYDFWTTGTADWQWRPGELPAELPPDAVALHTGSLAAWLPPSAEPVAALLERERARGRVTLSLDPNCRPALMGDRSQALAWIERLVDLVDVVKVSREDLAWLLPEEPVAEVAARWLARGPSLVVVTLGGEGGYALTAAGPVTVPAYPVPVVDTIGAGDAFTAGLLAALHRERLLGAAGRPALARLDRAGLGSVLARAAVVAGLTCARQGALGPSTTEVERALAARAGDGEVRLPPAGAGP